MVGDPRPTYQFGFFGGLSLYGEVNRRCTALDGGRSHRIGYELDDLLLVASIGMPMPARVADLIDVSAAVYIADRLALRQVPGDPRSPGDRWHRRIHVVIPVRCSEIWRRSEVVACLERLLAFLTDDIWTFEFTERLCAYRPGEAQVPLVQPGAHETAVTLLSGGLDSLFGLAHLLMERQDRRIVPVTTATNERVRHAASSIIHVIRQTHALPAAQMLPARLHVEISGEGRPRDDRESTQRARAMLFLASGIGVARIAGSDRLWVCENGVGAIGLPMSADHWGARSTRAIHPKTLDLMSKLAGIVLGRPFSIENIGLFTTKGVLGQNFALSPFAAAARHTISCDRAVYLGPYEACGKCTSCLLRRVALNAADMDDLAGDRLLAHRTDWLDPRAAWSGENSIHLWAMRDQVDRLREATDSEAPFAALARAFPGVYDVVALAPTLGLTESEVEKRLRQLYRTYVSEFDAFVTKIDRPGWGRKAVVTDLFPVPAKVTAG